MSTDKISIVHVHYKLVGGWHVFTSEDVKGLYVADQDPKQAFEALPKTIEKLVELNDGLSVQVRHVESYVDFVRAVRNPTPPTPVIKNHEYLVVPTAIAAE